MAAMQAWKVAKFAQNCQAKTRDLSGTLLLQDSHQDLAALSGSTDA